MNTKMSRRQKDIKSKLMAAIAMLLVSSIMMVSTTYAWFTLSTAPELKGITTAVGANGNLEMALVPLDAKAQGQLNDYGIVTGTTDSMAIQNANLANVTWGNLVDLSQYYGLEGVTLQPTALNKVAGIEQIVNAGGILSFPKYGADGRVAELSNGTVTGVYDTATASVYQTGRKPDATAEDGFTEITDPAGVRIIGAVSGMNERQLAHRNAVNAVTNNMSSAVAIARTALQNKGNDLAGIAVKYAADKENATYGQADVAVMEAMILELERALKSIENAYRQAAYANIIATNAGYLDQEAMILGNAAENNTPLTTIATNYSALATGVNALITSQGKVTSAKAALETLKTEGNAITFAKLQSALNYLADTDFMSVNGRPVHQVDAAYIAITFQQGINIVLETGSGIFADIADHCGDYGEGVLIPRELVGEVLGSTDLPEDYPGMEANMSTQSSVVPNYLNTAKTFANSVQAPGDEAGEAAAKPLSNFYGYIIDLAFRTNAPDSSLRLQTSAVDRIYTDGTENMSTMGGGSTMTFSKVDPSFSDAAMENLMKHVRVVFFDPDTFEIKGYAVPQIKERGSTIVAELLLATSPIPDTNGGYHLIQNNTLMDLVQNKAHRLSVLVYLDGTSITNADVAIGAGQSMTGSLNLQFSSSSELVPMDYSDLKENMDGMTDLTGKEGLTITATDGYSATNVTHHAGGMLGGVLNKNGVAVTDADATVKITAVVDGQTVTKDATYQNIGVIKGWAANGFGTDVNKITSISFEVTPQTGNTLTAITYDTGVTGTGKVNGNAVTINLNPPAGKTITAANAVVTGKEITNKAYSNGKLTFNCAGIKTSDAIKVTTTLGYTVTKAAGVNGNATVDEGAAYTFTLTEGYTDPVVTIGGVAFTGFTASEGTYTIPAASITGNIEITVTAPADGGGE